MNKELAQKAAKWWADQLRKPAKLDNGDKSDTGFMTFMLATMLQNDSPKHPEDKVRAFEDALAEVLETIDDRWVSIGVDYHPDFTLQSVADGVGLNLGMTDLPWKTHMSIHDGKITVSEGYQAALVEI